MQPFRIPTSFWLMGHHIHVEWHDEMVAQRDLVGEACYNTNCIHLQADVPGLQRASGRIEQTFFHELLHFCFEVLHQDDLRKDEQLIDQLSGLLHQAFVTAEYAPQEELSDD